MRVTIDANRVRFEQIGRKTVNSLYKDDYIKEQYRDDLTPFYKYAKRDNVTYQGVFIDGDLAGMFYCVDISPIEIEVHMAFYKEYTVYARTICNEFKRWMLEDNNIYRITTYVMDYRRKAVNMLLKIGFKYEGFMNKCAVRDGVWYGKHVLGITKE